MSNLRGTEELRGARVALLSCPQPGGKRSLMERLRAYCAQGGDVFHYEVEHAGQIGAALRTIAEVKPVILAINGGDNAVRATLTELHRAAPFGATPPPVAVLPNGQINLIALELGSEGDAIAALDRMVRIAREDVAPHVVVRELIALRRGRGGAPVLGMFCGGAGLAETMLYCRTKLYPLGLPEGVAHGLGAAALFVSSVFGLSARFLPRRPRPLSVSVVRRGAMSGTYSLLIVTTLQRLLFGPGHDGAAAGGSLRLVLVERSAGSMLGTAIAALRGRLGQGRLEGVHLDEGDEIVIEGERPRVLLDGELFEAKGGQPIILTRSAPVPFLSLAA